MIGKKLGRYEILAKLGAGGMGEVYRARDLSLGRDIALKLLPEHVREDADRLRRFEQEARAASALNHPNIITIYDIGQSDGIPYIAMEIVLGHTLRSLLAGRPLLTKRALALAAQAAEGLARAHAIGIIHRDLKPENLMVTRDGFLKILDFGLAKLHEPDPLLASDAPTEPGTRPGVLMGTVGYMSPEQARGRPVDFRTDQFSCGSILYELATSRRAFEKESPVQTLSAIIESEPEPIQNLNPEVPPPFRWIVERCLKKNPEERYASTLDLARELRNVHDRLAEVSSGAGSGPRSLSPMPWGRGTWLRPATLAAALAVASAVAGALWLQRGEARSSITDRVPRDKQIAVLPFTSASGTEAEKVFSDGLVDALTGKLTLFEQFQGSLWLVPASEIRSSGVTSVQEARKAFGVTLAINGSLQRTADRVRLIANLVDAISLRQLRSITIDRSIEDLLSLQDGMTAAIAEMLELELQPEARRVITAGGTAVPGAYDHYVRGRGYMQRYEKAESLDLAAASFQRALEQDPSYALAYAGLGETYWRRYNLTKGQEWIDLARRSCTRAVELNDLLAPVHVTLGLLYTGTGQHKEAVAQFETALKLDPMAAEGFRGLASAYEAMGRLSEAEATYRRAVDLKPSQWSGHSYLGVFLSRHGRYEEAAAAFRRVIALTPDNVRGYNNLGAVLKMLGRYDEAVATLKRSLALQPTPGAYTNLGTILFFEGRYAEAVPMMEQATALGSKNHLLWGNLADAYAFTPNLATKAPAAYRRAIELVEKDLAVNPKEAPLQASLAWYRAKLGDKDIALSAIAKALTLAPANAEVVFKSAVVFELSGHRDQALQALRDALKAGYSSDAVLKEPRLEGLRQDPRGKQALEGYSRP